MTKTAEKTGHHIIKRLFDDRVKIAQGVRGIQKISELRKQVLEKRLDRTTKIEGSDSTRSKNLKERYQYEVSASKYFKHTADRLENTANSSNEAIEQLKAKYGIE